MLADTMQHASHPGQVNGAPSMVIHQRQYSAPPSCGRPAKAVGSEEGGGANGGMGALVTRPGVTCQATAELLVTPLSAALRVHLVVTDNELVRSEKGAEGGGEAGPGA